MRSRSRFISALLLGIKYICSRWSICPMTGRLKLRFHLATLKRWLLLVSLVTIILVVFTSFKAQFHPPIYRLIHKIPEATFNCPTLLTDSSKNGFKKWKDHSTSTSSKIRVDPKVLLFVDNSFSRIGREIPEILVHNRIKYKFEVSLKSLPTLASSSNVANADKGRFSVIVFENYTKYLTMDKWNKELLDKYCREFDIGILGFMPSRDETLVGYQLRNSSLYIDTNIKLKDAYLNPNSEILRLTRAGDIVRGLLPNDPGDLWTVFSENHTTYEPLMMATPYFDDDYVPAASSSFSLETNMPLISVIQDKGELDGIRKVLFGAGLKFWLNRLLFLDAMSYLSRGRLSVSLKRYILVDVDDIFVGEKGTRLKKSDIEAILDTQERLRKIVPGFKFNLGFSGKYFHCGDEEENAGDDILLKNSDKFMWFGHMYNHLKPHLYGNLTHLCQDMQKNKDFAKEHGISTNGGYSVSPHHSGVYPVHETLYEAWKKVWNIKTTSTEEYPHLRPARLRRGFIHRGIMVLPRQTCGLFTHTIFIDRYPGGQSKLEESIFGGELFQTIIFNVINIFMTHMSNYGNDRLGLYTFESVIKFVNCWTNLQMVTVPPVPLAEKYFKMHSEEMDPIWGNPCDDIRHKKIWSLNKTCTNLPQFLVVGPQKTGTTALYTFLTMHPAISSNKPSPETFEEVQFFNGKNYYRGLDWYMKFFQGENETIANQTNTITSNSVSSSIRTIEMIKPPILFEKSANYFDNEFVPRRSHTLLPKAKIIIILISPARRAHSWYQHMKAHGDSVANNYTFYDVLSATSISPKPLRDLRNRCLSPGRYAQHIERWLIYYPSNQLLILDGDELKNNPISVMNHLQTFLKIDPVYNYSTRIRFDKNKGFYCQIINLDSNKTKCLGSGKGRKYPQMDPKSSKYLQDYYLNHNTVLVKLLKRLDLQIPNWLKEDLT